MVMLLKRGKTGGTLLKDAWIFEEVGEINSWATILSFFLIKRSHLVLNRGG